MIPKPASRSNRNRQRIDASRSSAASQAIAMKSFLVDLGLLALARGEWGMVAAITTVIARKELSHG